MDSIYQIYHFWLNRRRKDAIVAAVSSAETWQGLRHWNRIVESEIVSYDFGVVRADRLDRYCAGDWIKQENPGRCEYRYAYAVVPGSPWNDPRVNTAIADSYRPAQLARRLAALGWKQSANDWSDPALIATFTAHVDSEKLFAPLVHRSEVSASSCPSLGKAIGGLGQVSFDLSPEAIDSPVDVMAPHGSRTEVRLTAADNQGRAVILGGAAPLHGYLTPIWTAIKSCAPIRG